MKNLAKCKPSEFVSQTAKIKNAVNNWMEVVEFMKIRNRTPNYKTIPVEASAEERAEVIKQNAELAREQTLKDFNELLDNMLVSHPQETLNVLALCCFVEPENVDDYTIDEYLDCILDMIQSKSVINFFSLLGSLGAKNTSQALKVLT